MEKLTVIIPSRTHEKQVAYIQRATESIRNQRVADRFSVTVLIGVDKNCALDPAVSARLGVRCVESAGASQAAALNGAISQLTDGFVAFLEDDDQWMPDYLDFASQAIASCDFVSSTQAECNESDELLKINDFPTPSGWFMRVSVLKAVGGFNEDYRLHLDNEWLGRLSESKFKRMHLVESTAPIHPYHVQQVRPWLEHVLLCSEQGGGILARHTSPYPLVRRLAHSQSGMAQIATNSDFSEISRKEHEKLVKRFGRMPW